MVNLNCLKSFPHWVSLLQSVYTRKVHSPTFHKTVAATMQNTFQWSSGEFTGQSAVLSAC